MKHVAENIISAQHVSDDVLDLQAYSYDASQTAARPRLIVWPADPDELRKLLIRFGAGKQPLVVRGFATNLVGATLAPNAAVVQMTRMASIIRLDRTKLLVTVEAGCSLDDLNAFLAQHGLEFPVQPWHAHHTIGAMIAMNAIGMASHRFGRMASNTHSYEYFDATGKRYETKDVTLLAGTEGTVGIITQATLKVVPTITIRSASHLVFDDLPSMLRELAEIKRDPDVLWCELLDKRSSSMVGLGDRLSLIIAYTSNKGELKDEERVGKLVDKRLGVDHVLSMRGHIFREDGEVPHSRIYDLIEWCEEHEVPVCAHAGLNLLLPYFSEDQRGLIAQFYKRVRDVGGEVAGAYGIGVKKKQYASKSWRERIKRLKDQYDYYNLFNPGKIMEYR